MAAQRCSYWILSVLVTTGLSQSSFAQFTPLICDSATKFVEKTTCSNPKLTELDSELYNQLEHAEQVTNVPLQVLELSQQNWIKQRNQCKNTACIETSYKTRLQEIKNLNAMNQDFVQYLIRVKEGKPDPQLSLLQLQSLDEKRIRIIAQSFWNSADHQHNQVVNFNGYANQGKKISVKDLDTKCVLILKQHQKRWEVRQASPMCGNKHIRFSGFYEPQK
ncbi:lysozyme inhibitor LprI family protein [Alkanindiges sp. WGS2144]|uniref:lysozyme inhibitor LprI family protein n=1 Tax=Alkanindiges sp. WGS2144 TaxID=3366808 RepID=UPI003751A26B